ncbi:MAG TPA: 16S rRNA (guanine(527)-N(7))-methyltransferase RsmG [Solirubrobacteraceae bacterium]|nr:16S rRNA (guanine(527)-N(7))-methyltransferase RsmG [Solirubrobacteraceae bacterium]
MNVDRRLDELIAQYELAPEAARTLSCLLGLICGDPTAPTTIREPAAAVDAHVADALVALELRAVRTARRVADLGSGAGFPGLVLAVARPEAEIVLVESNHRKCEFLERAAVKLELANIMVVRERAESWVEGFGTRDLVTARALAPLPVLVEYAAPLLAPGGALVAWKGRRDDREEADGAAAAAVTGLEPAEIMSVRPWTGAEQLHLHLYLKVGLTPNRFPRRPGMARKKPLQASG